MEKIFTVGIYKGESRQREESRLNMASRLNQTLRGGSGREKRGAANQGGPGQEAKKPEKPK